MSIVKIKWIWFFVVMGSFIACDTKKQSDQVIQEENPAPAVIIASKPDSNKLDHQEQLNPSKAPEENKEGNKIESPKSKHTNAKRVSFEYDFNSPDQTFALAKSLREISGLSYTENGQILAVNDELGIIYTLSPNSGEILQKEKFRSKGDYEGIEKIKDVIYVLKSNGTLYSRFPNGSKDPPSINTPLKAVNDVEGLGYDPKKNELLLACKGKCLSPSDQSKGYKSIYAFDLQSQTLKESPRFSIQTTTLFNHLPKGQIDAISSQKEINRIKNRTRNFAPSGIAVHPITNDVFVLSSAGKAIAQCNTEGEVITLHLLNHKSYIQPEGICFATDGTLFVSNEGKKGRANLMVFNPK